MQLEESLEKSDYDKEIWRERVAKRREEDKEENGGETDIIERQTVSTPETCRNSCEVSQQQIKWWVMVAL